MGPSPDEIKRDIDRTRAELVADANRLADHTSPRRIVQRRADRVRHGFTSLKERVMGTVSEGTTTLQDGTRDVASTAGERVQDAAHAVRDTAGHAAEAVQSAPRQAMRQAQGNPLAAGLVAFGGGLLVASLLPKSRTERQAVQRLNERASGVVEPVKEALTESAQKLKQDVGARVGDAAGEVRQTAAEAAQTTAAQAKDTAREVADHARESGQQVKQEARGQ